MRHGFFFPMEWPESPAKPVEDDGKGKPKPKPAE